MMPIFELSELAGAGLEKAAFEYARDGYIILEGVGRTVTSLFEPFLHRIFDGADVTSEEVLRPTGQVELSLAVRKQISKVASSSSLAAALLQRLGGLFKRLIGPIIHVSSTFHLQIKGGGVAAPAVDHGGYPDGTRYLEPCGLYLLHQDFTGATIPTSPSALTLWVALNDCPDYNLRIFPGSHRKGMLCNRWVDLASPDLAPLGEPVDIVAKRGRAVVFNAMCLHGSSNPGAQRRVSCDIRFFPLCGFLPSTPWILGEDPLEELTRANEGDAPVLRSPRLEARAFLGEPVEVPAADGEIVYRWPRYVAALCRGDETAASELARYANPEVTGETGDVYVKKYHGKPIFGEMLTALRERLTSDPEGDTQRLTGLAAPLAAHAVA